MTRWAWAFVAAAVGLGLAACSDDAEETATIDPAADEAVIEGAILTLDDLPDGFEASEPDDDDDEEAVLAACLAEADVDLDEISAATVVEGERVAFQLVNEELLVLVSASITSFDDDAAPRRQIDAYGDRAFLDCIVEDAEADAEDVGEGELPVTEIAATAADPPVPGDAAATVDLTFSTDGVPSLGAQHLLLVGRFGIFLQVLSIGEGFDDDVAGELLELMAERVAGDG